jgi:hypothetical protein
MVKNSFETLLYANNLIEFWSELRNYVKNFERYINKTEYLSMNENEEDCRQQ